MTEADFYSGKLVTEVVWYLDECALPEALYWARLRIFDDGTADVFWDDQNSTAYGFDNRTYASYFLGEEEFIRFGDWDADDEQAYGVRAADLAVPDWSSHSGHNFRHYGTY
jgi:hypothetical protein